MCLVHQVRGAGSETSLAAMTSLAAAIGMVPAGSEMNETPSRALTPMTTTDRATTFALKDSGIGDYAELQHLTCALSLLHAKTRMHTHAGVALCSTQLVHARYPTASSIRCVCVCVCVCAPRTHTHSLGPRCAHTHTRPS